MRCAGEGARFKGANRNPRRPHGAVRIGPAAGNDRRPPVGVTARLDGALFRPSVDHPRPRGEPAALTFEYEDAAMAAGNDRRPPVGGRGHGGLQRSPPAAGSGARL